MIEKKFHDSTYQEVRFTRRVSSAVLAVIMN